MIFQINNCRIFGRACLRSQCCCDYADMNYEDSVGGQRLILNEKFELFF